MLMNEEVFHIIIFILFAVALVAAIFSPFPVTIADKTLTSVLLVVLVLVVVVTFLRKPKIGEEDDEDT